MSFSFSKRRVVTAAAIILLALFLVRPGVSRLKERIANSIGNAVARPVTIGSVHLQFLPPGFYLQNLVISEDPAFGAEAMLRAPEVTASVRLSSLLRGRFDIARLELTEPSLNLVRRADGRWNWEALLERTARTPLAPTGKSKTESRPEFPYIEASSGRINFKKGPEKKPYALLNADFALWQESENTWGTRLKAQPLRTDMSLSDTGILRMSGTWQRAGSLGETPLQFTMEWDRAQLGQLTKLISGSDKGWRGEVRLEATLGGMPAAMKVSADTSIDNFHRYDITGSEGVRLAAHCGARYSSTEEILHDILCSSPVGGGMITVRGEAGLPGAHKVDLALNLADLPMNAIAQLARRVKKNLPIDLASEGIVQGDFEVSAKQGSTEGADFHGRGEITGLHLQSVKNKVELPPMNVPFVLNHRNFSIQSKATRSLWSEQAADGVHVELGPFPVALGRPVPAQAHAWIGRSGYGIAIRGDGDIAQSLRLANLLGLQALRTNAEGAAQMDLQISGMWAENVLGTAAGFSMPELTGTAQLRNVRAMVRGANRPIEISSAQLLLGYDGVRVEKLVARAADADWTGSLVFPRGCGAPDACLIRFNLNTAELGLAELYEWFGSRPSQARWYQILSNADSKPPSFFKTLQAVGKMSAGRLQVHNVIASHVFASLEMDHGKLKISDLRAEALGGKWRGDWHADFTDNPPMYAGSGALSGISLEEVAGAMHDPWISGTAAGTYQFTAVGADATAFWQSVEGELQFDLQDGTFSHILLPSDERPLHVARWQGSARVRTGKIELEKEKLFASEGTYEVGGTASFGRALNLTLTRSSDTKAGSSQSYSITGTVEEPQVTLTPTPDTQAQLKP